MNTRASGSVHSPDLAGNLYPGLFSLAFHHVIVYKSRIFLDSAAVVHWMGFSFALHASKIKGLAWSLLNSACAVVSLMSDTWLFGGVLIYFVKVI